MDIAATLDQLVFAAQYSGSVTANTKASYDAIDWQDSRAKPAWSALQARQIDLAKKIKIKEMTASCGEAIVGGFISSALGAPYTYPSAINDQINLMGSVTASLLPGLVDGWVTPFWCADSAGTWNFHMHNAAQIQAVGSDGKAHVVTCQGALDQLSAAVMAATSEAAVAAIVWPAA